MKKAIFSIIIATTVFGLAYYLFWIRNPDLDTVMTVVPVLASGIPANVFVRPDLSRRPVHDSEYVQRGHYTVIVYHMKECPDCQRLDKELEYFLALRRDVAVRKIDLGKHWSAASTMRDYGRKVGWTPFVVIYGTDGKPIRADDGGNRYAGRLLDQWIKKEFKKSGMRITVKG